MVIVDRNQWFFAVIEDALQRALRCGLERRINLFAGRITARRKGQVDEADVGRRHADRRPVELALEFGQDFGNGTRSAVVVGIIDMPAARARRISV